MRRLLLAMVARAMLAVAFVVAPVTAVAQQDPPLDRTQLLEQVRQGRTLDRAENQRREAAFLAEKAEQDEKIRQAQQELRRLEAKSAELEAQFDDNEKQIAQQREQREQRLGSLKELFGHLSAAAGDMRARFRSSISSSEFAGREAFLSGFIQKLGSDSDLPSIDEIRQIWFELHRELTESGRVVKYPAVVGTEPGREIVRIGLFNLVSNGEYLAYDADTRAVSVLPRQPRGLATGARQLQQATTGYVAVGIDPTGAAGGGFLRAIINTPTWLERWQQGRVVGYIITAIGALALVLAAVKFISLAIASAAIGAQMKRKQINPDNPLGRVLQAAEEHSAAGVESLELHLGEAVLKEGPKLMSGLALLRIFAMVAPLLGLLGTVTGMIIVFQAMTIYGAGDPQAMAGGISSALVTTALGLIVAIPTLLLHSLLHSRARRLLHILEQQSAGIVAERAGK